MPEYSQTCHKIPTDIQIAFKNQTNSLKCLHCVLYKDSVKELIKFSVLQYKAS